MNCDKFIYRLAGSMVLISCLLGMIVNKNWFYLNLFVGANLLQYSFSGFCPAKKIFCKR